MRSYLVPSLEDVPELRGCCRNMPGGSALVIPFATPLVDGESQFNHFGFLIGGGDAGFNSSLIDSKLTTVRVLFDGYDNKNLSLTPRLYLVPVGQDDFRSPARPHSAVAGSGSSEIRSWSLGPQRLPEMAPGQVVATANDGAQPPWVYHRRRFGPFAAKVMQNNDPEQEARVTKQYFGRSIYNTRWLLVIPAKLLNAEISEDDVWGYFLGRSGSSAGVKEIGIEFTFTAREGA